MQEYAFENAAWKMTAIFSRPQCVKPRGMKYAKIDLSIVKIPQML